MGIDHKKIKKAINRLINMAVIREIKRKPFGLMVTMNNYDELIKMEINEEINKEDEGRSIGRGSNESVNETENKTVTKGKNMKTYSRNSRIDPTKTMNTRTDVEYPDQEGGGEV